ncbi:MAG: hypothetical protein WA584_18180 [Pyrinomonadaceae bacterium]
MSSFEVFIDAELRLVKVTAFGEFFQKDGEEIITTARKAAAEHDYNIIYDMRQATTTVAFASWFNLPRNLDVFKDIEPWRTRVAVLASKQDKALNDYKFYETVTGNLGLKIRVFFEETEAMKWLGEKL